MTSKSFCFSLVCPLYRVQKLVGTGESRFDLQWQTRLVRLPCLCRIFPFCTSSTTLHAHGTSFVLCPLMMDPLPSHPHVLVLFRLGMWCQAFLTWAFQDTKQRSLGWRSSSSHVPWCPSSLTRSPDISAPSCRCRRGSSVHGGRAVESVDEAPRGKGTRDMDRRGSNVVRKPTCRRRTSSTNAHHLHPSKRI